MRDKGANRLKGLTIFVYMNMWTNMGLPKMKLFL